MFARKNVVKAELAAVVVDKFQMFDFISDNSLSLNRLSITAQGVLSTKTVNSLVSE